MTNINVNKSGGVIVAAITIKTMTACFLYVIRKLEEINSNLAKMNATTGNWNTSPITNVKVEKVEIYDASVMVFFTEVSTWYVPRKRKDTGGYYIIVHQNS